MNAATIHLDDADSMRVVVRALDPGNNGDPYASLFLLPDLSIASSDPEVFDALARRATQARDRLVEQLQRRQR